MKTKNRLFVAFALGTLVTAGSAWACPGGDANCASEPSMVERSAPGPGGPIMHLIKGLNLTPDQDTQIRNILKEDGKAMNRDVGRMRAHRDAMRDLMHSKTFDEGKARAIAEDDSKRMLEMRVAMLKTEYMIYQILTPEQRLQLDKIMVDGPRPRPSPGAPSGLGDMPPPPPLAR